MAAAPKSKLENDLVKGEMPVAKKEIYVKDLKLLSHAELIEIKKREGELLSKKLWLDRLPDKGKRIQDFYAKVEAELERRNNVEEAASMLSDLKLTTCSTAFLNKLEWTGRLSEATKADPVAVLDSDDEEEVDPLRLIAQQQMHERRTKVLPAEPVLITPADLADIEGFKKEAEHTNCTDSVIQAEATEDTANTEAVESELVTIDVSKKLTNIKNKLKEISDGNVNKSENEAKSEIEKHALYLMEKTESLPQQQREKFKPYRTTISNVHDPAKERLRKQGKYWEVTAATPPPIQTNGTEFLSLLETVEIQNNHIKRIKELEERQAEERLATRLKRLEARGITLPPDEILKTKEVFKKYRNPANDIEGCNLSEYDEVYDTLDEEKSSGCVTYTTYEYT